MRKSRALLGATAIAALSLGAAACGDDDDDSPVDDAIDTGSQVLDTAIATGSEVISSGVDAVDEEIDEATTGTTSA